jgi:hypothetical protein
VFIAHTSALHELPEKRSFVGAARDPIVAAGDLPMEMALCTASERPPAELCRENVREADVLVLIAGFRYGSPVIDEATVITLSSTPSAGVTAVAISARFGCRSRSIRGGGRGRT